MGVKGRPPGATRTERDILPDFPAGSSAMPGFRRFRRARSDWRPNPLKMLEPGPVAGPLPVMVKKELPGQGA